MNINQSYNNLTTQLNNIELLSIKRMIKSRKKFLTLNLLLVFASIFFLIINISHNTYGTSFYIWIFNFVWNLFFTFYHILHINKENKKYLSLLKSYKPDVYKQKMRKKILKKISRWKLKHLY